MQQRRLAAIMFTDIVGYTSLMSKDEDHAFEVLSLNKEIHAQLIEKYHGILIKEMSGGMLVSFHSSVDAVWCAIEIQKECKKSEIPLKIGIHEGDLVFAGEDVHGDGVNIASRLEAITETGNITISEAIYNNVRTNTGIRTAFLGERMLKNVEEPVKVYQVSDEELNIERQSEKRKTLSKTKSSVLVTAVLIIAGALYLIWNFVPGVQKIFPGDQSGIMIDKSIAVLPFSTFSNDTSNQYFANGIRSEIINKLNKIEGLKVALKSSADTYQDTDKGIPQIAEELGVAAILEAEAEKFEDKIRIRIRLIDGEKDSRLWAQEYNTEFSSIWGIYSEIAENVASELKLVLTEELKQLIGKPLTSNMTAYEYILRGYEEMEKYWWSWLQKYVDKAEEYFKKAFELDPDSEFAKAQSWANKANIYFVRHYNRYDPYIMKDYLDSVIWYCNNATSISPDVISWPIKGEANYSRGYIDQAIDAYEEWLERYPENSQSLMYLGFIKIFTDDYFNGISMIKKAVKLLEGSNNNRYWYQIYRLGLAYQVLGDYEKADFYTNKAHELGLGCFMASMYPLFKGEHEKAMDMISDCGGGFPLHRGEIYLQRREYDNAAKEFHRGSEGRIKNGNVFYTNYREGFALLQMGKDKEGNEIIENDLNYMKRLKELNRPDDHNYHLAAIYAFRGASEKALQHLKDYQHQVIWLDILPWQHPLEYSQHDILFENLWEHPGYKDFMKEYHEKKTAIRDLLRQLEGADELD